MRPIRLTTFTAFLLAFLLAQPLAAQAPAAGGDAAPRENPRENQPNWPQGVESWDSEERDPPDVDPNAAEKRGLTSPEVRESLMPEPTPQGTRAPSPEVSGEEEPEYRNLYSALEVVRRAPPGLDGTAIPRPNPMAQEPEADESRPKPPLPGSQN